MVLISDEQWDEFQHLLEQPARDPPKLRALLTRPSPLLTRSRHDREARCARKLTKADVRERFDSGAPELDEWLARYSWQNQHAHNAVTYVRSSSNGSPSDTISITRSVGPSSRCAVIRSRWASSGDAVQRLLDAD